MVENDDNYFWCKLITLQEEMMNLSITSDAFKE